ncbi:MAG TPA: TonB-dependent receptor [Candidatus Kapabacteria bacterium]
MKYLLIALFPIVFSHSVRAQVSVATVFGHVKLADPSDADNLTFGLQDVTTSALVEVDQPDSTGAFEFPEVPFGTYDLYLREQNRSVFVCRIALTSPVPVQIDLDSVPSIENGVAAPNWSLTKTRSQTTFTAPMLPPLPVENTAYELEEAERQSPGILPSANEGMHLRGEGPAPQYIVDGIRITSQETRLTMPIFEPSLIQSADLLRDDLDARYGANGVMNITTKSGFDATTFGHADYTIGTDGNSSQEVDLGGRADNAFAYYASYGSFGSNRYLDPLTGSAPNHTTGSGSDYFGKINILASDALTITSLGYYGSSNFQIPNDMNAILQDRNNDIVSTMFGGRIDYNLTERSILSLTGYTRRQSQSYTSNGASGVMDSSTEASAFKSDNYFIASRNENFESGGELSYTAHTDWFGAHNNFEIGAEAEIFPLAQYFTFAVVNPTLGDTVHNLSFGGTPFLYDSSITGKRISAYAEDDIKSGSWLIAPGIRYDLYSLLDNESGISPRLNLAYQASDALTLRASYNSIFQQAPLENILVSSSIEMAQALGTAQNDVQAERSNNFGVGANYALDKYLSLDLSGYDKIVRNMLTAFDLDQSELPLPANIKNGKIYGGELELDLRNWNHFSGMLTVSSCTSLGTVPSDGSSSYSAGAIGGGLAQSYAAEMIGHTTFQTAASEPIAATFFLKFQPAPEYYFALSGRYDKGLAFGVFPPPVGPPATPTVSPTAGYENLLTLNSDPATDAVAPHAILNFSASYNLSHFGLPVMISASVINIFNTTYLTEFDPIEGGAHYGSPREFLIVGELSP